MNEVLQNMMARRSCRSFEAAQVAPAALDEILNAKVDQNAAKYPVEKARGSAAKYTELT